MPQYVSNGNHYGRIQVGGKTIRESLETCSHRDACPGKRDNLNSTNCNPVALAPIQIGNRLVVTYPPAQGERYFRFRINSLNDRNSLFNAHAVMCVGKLVFGKFCCVFRCCRTRIPIPVGQHSGVAGQFSERSDALEEVIEMCPTGVNLFPGFSACFGAPPRGDAPAVNPTLDRAVYSGGR